MASGWLQWAAPAILLMCCSPGSQAAVQGTLLELINTEGNLVRTCSAISCRLKGSEASPGWHYKQCALQTLLASAVNASGLSSLFGDPMQRITIFAPTDGSFTSALQFGALQCTTDYYSTGPCTSVSQLLAATDLASIVRNFGKPSGPPVCSHACRFALLVADS